MSQSVFINVPRWGLLALLVFAPWAYGCTRPWEKSLLTTGLLVVVGLFLLSLLAKPRLPKLNIVSVILTGFLLLQGWIMVLNPKQKFVPTIFAYINLPRTISWLPGVVDEATAKSQLWLVTGLIGAFWVSSDLAASARWRTRTWWVMSSTGISLVVLGLAQRLTSARAIFWDPSADTGTTFFATYRYHGNAGAFLNLVLPLIAAQAILAILRRHSHRSMTFWSVATLTTAACAFINVSKAAMVITGFMLLAQSYQERRQTGFGSCSKTRLTVMGGVFAVMILGLIWAIGFGDSMKRWIDFNSSGNYGPRWLADEAMVRYALPTSGWWGFGPGTFPITFPFFTQPLGDRVAGVWQNAHQDYLQALMEWGYIGGAVWAVLIFGGLATAVTRHLGEQRTWDNELRLFSSACILSLCGVLLHATVDFPLEIPSLQLYAAVILGFLWNLSDLRGRRKRRATARGSKASCKIVEAPGPRLELR